MSRSATHARPPAWQVWLLAARPKTLWAGVAPVLMGSALAWRDGAFLLPTALVCLLTGISVQVGANYANDYFDHVKGTDTAARIGPTRATQAGLVTPRQMRLAFTIAFTITELCAIWLAWRGGWWIAGLGLVCIACGILYTGGPAPLGYIGLGDLFAFVFFGPVALVATYYLQTLNADATIWIAGLAPGFFSVALLTVNNLRDIEQDAAGGKRTLAVRFGRNFARTEYVLCLAGALLVPIVMVMRDSRSPWILLSLLVILPALLCIRLTLTRTDGPTLNRCLAITGAMELLFALLFSLGALIS